MKNKNSAKKNIVSHPDQIPHLFTTRHKKCTPAGAGDERQRECRTTRSSNFSSYLCQLKLTVELPH